VQSTCGNSVVEGGEECDDGNTSNGDACNSQCKFPAGKTQEDAAPTCKAILATGKSTGSGVYWLNPSKGPTAGAFTAYCDMSVAGGGWAVFLSGSQLSQVFTSAAVGTPGAGSYKLSDTQIGQLLGAATDTYNVRLECGTRVATIQLPAGWTSIGDITTCVGAVGGTCLSSNGHTYYTGLYASTDSALEFLTTMLKPSMYGSGYPPCRVHNVGDFSARYLAR
jgi:cysteine-rich repeat protein